MTLALTLLTAQTAWAWQGLGTYESPYQISSTEDLDQLAANVNRGTGDADAAFGYDGKYFVLTNDIDYSHKADGEEGADTENNYTAIGYAGGVAHPFRGHFDGQGHTVSGIRIYKSGSNYKGLFGYIYFAEVKNVTLADARITGYSCTGGIVGWNEGGDVTNCHVLSDVTIGAKEGGTNYHGGIVGMNSGGTVSGCTSAASITTTASGCQGFGGVVGCNEGTVSDCLYLGSYLGGEDCVGAIVGNNECDYAIVQNCYYTSTAITGKGGSGGTIDNADCAVGYKGYGPIAKCGLARTVAAGMGVTINAIALTGTATHYDDYHDIITAYSGGGIEYAGNRYYGNGCTVSLALSTTIAPGTTGPGYYPDYTPSTGTLSGNATDGYTLTMDDADATISMVIDWATESSGDSWDNAYMIYNKHQLDLLAHRVNSGTTYEGKYFVLPNDISYTHDTDWDDAASTENNYTAIGCEGQGGNNPFRGIFDGKGHTVSGIRIYKSGNQRTDWYQGLFGCTDGAEVKNVNLADARITGYASTAGIVGWNEFGTITNCHVLSNVTIHAVASGTLYHGGIVGENHDGTVSGCTSAASITTTASVCFDFGGVVGDNFGGTVRDCLYLGNTVEGINAIGAIVGYNDGNTAIVQNCYFTSTTITGKDENGGTLSNADCAVGSNTGTVAATVGLARTVAAGTGVTINSIALTGTATDYRDITGMTGDNIITAYSGGGIVYAGKAYCPGGSSVSLTLSYTPKVGYTFNGFTASAGTLSGNATDGYTLAMPDGDVTISADITAIPWAGTGTEGDPYVISYPSQLDLLAERVNSGTGDDYAASGYSGKYFQLGDDIAYDPDNLTIDTNNDGTMDSNYKAIGGYYGGNRYFKGHFDGQGHTISGIRIYWNGVSTSWDCHKGLFGWIDDAVVENVTLADAHITGNERIGGIVGCIGSYESVNPGTVSNCHVLSSVTIDAVVSDAWYHGGIVGYNNGGTVSGCTSAASITTTSSTNSRQNGGIAGTNYGSSARVSDCLYLGTTVEGIKRVGAIVGNNYAGQVQNCYFSNTTFQGKDNNGNNLDNANSAVGYNENGGTVSGCGQANVVNVSYLDENGDTQTRYAIELVGTETADGDGRINLGYAAYYVGSDINYTNRISFTNDAILILGDGATMTVNYGNNDAINTDNPLTICGQTLGTGQLNATSTNGGDYGIRVGNGDLTINGGTVTANGGNGNGIHVENGNVTINGGNVTATGVNCGIWANNGNVTINGGNVTANGRDYGIRASGIITIDGGNVTANGDYGISADGKITLGWTNASDRIFASSFYIMPDIITINDGQRLTDAYGNHYYGYLPAEAISCKHLYPYIETLDLAANKAPDQNYWTTFYCGHTDYEIDADENACAYTATVSGDQLTLHKLGKVIPKNTAVILVGADNSISMTASDETATVPTNNLHGVDTRTATADIKSALGDGTFYVLSQKGSNFGFFEYTGEYMPARKAYLLVNGGAALARELTMVFDEETGIRPTPGPSLNGGEWYDLSGRKLDGKPTKKGIYVNKGHKVVVK